MRARTFLLLSLVFSILQGPLLPPVFSEGILLLLFVPYQPARKLLPALFLSGVFFDLFQSQTLGVTSLLFLFFAGLFIFLGDQLNLRKPVFLLIFVLAVTLLRAKIVFGTFPF